MCKEAWSIMAYVEAGGRRRQLAAWYILKAITILPLKKKAAWLHSHTKTSRWEVLKVKRQE